MQNGVVPGNLEKLEDLLHRLLRLQHKLLVVDHHTAILSNLLALIVHRRDCLIPLLHALTIIGEIEAGDGDFPRNYWMDGGATVANHEKEFCLQDIFTITVRVLRTKILLTFGKSSITYEPILSVSGSLLHSRGAGSPCLAMISKQNCAIALLSTSLCMPASSSRMLSFSDFIQCERSWRIRGMTRVSWPHRTSGWASSIARISVVPERGTPPINTSGMFRW